MASVQELLNSSETTGVWNLVPDRSTVGFRAKSMWGAMPVKGRFSEISGDGQVTGSGAVFGRVDIRAASLRTGIKKRDADLMAADFFDVEKFPDISVVVTGAEPTGPDTATLRADLTVKDVTRPIELPATVKRLDDGSIQVTATTTVDRTDFGVTGNMLGMVGKTVKAFGDLVFIRAKE
ncbi:YceI family protein [Mycobacterium hubeiense]|uniref:YceI family protein n=1 Tax=Mycobacterium hubeiense TaxID=1867256 RepID=UPI000C7ED63C|nr:YceI family protein [Mycobacterium sp. QGD 101]